MTGSKNLLWLIFFICIPLKSLHTQNIDVTLLRNIHTPHYTKADGTFKFLSNTTTFISLSLPAGYLLYGWIKSNSIARNKGLVLLGSLTINGLFTGTLKYTLMRPRPFIDYPEYFFPKSHGGSPSMPSGHTSIAFATATTLSLEKPCWYVIIPAYLWASSVAYSRMHLGVHYPSDVLMGIAVGSTSAYIAFKVNKWLKKKYLY